LRERKRRTARAEGEQYGGHGLRFAGSDERLYSAIYGRCQIAET
jgi:hypothetical protein